MGAIISDFPSLPQDANPHRVQHFQQCYATLLGLGLTLPLQPASTVTRAQLLAHLQVLAGQIIKDELTNNPDSVDYAGTNAATADNIGKAYATPQGRRWPGSHPTGYQVAAGSTALGLVLLTNPGLVDPGFLGAAFADLPAGNGVIRFRNTTATVALQGRVRQITLVVASGQIGLAGPLPVIPAVGDVLDLGLTSPPLNVARISQILRGFPFAPNALTTADIAAAKL